MLLVSLTTGVRLEGSAWGQQQEREKQSSTEGSPPAQQAGEGQEGEQEEAQSAKPRMFSYEKRVGDRISIRATYNDLAASYLHLGQSVFFCSIITVGLVFSRGSFSTLFYTCSGLLHDCISNVFRS